MADITLYGAPAKGTPEKIVKQHIKIGGVDTVLYPETKVEAVKMADGTPLLLTLIKYQTSEQVQSAINTAIGNINKMTKKVVDSLPATGEDNVIYLVPDDKGKSNKDMYLWIDGAFVLVGNTETDLTGYFNETNLPAITTAQIDAIIDGTTP